MSLPHCFFISKYIEIKITVGGTMKNLFRFIIVSIFVLGFHQSVLAQSPLKFGVVDIQEVQQKSMAFEKERAKLQKELEGMQKRLTDERNALQKLQEDYEKQSMMLSLDAQEDKKREYESKARHLNYLAEDFQATAQHLETAATTRLLNELSGVVREIGLKGGYTIILQKRGAGLLYNDGAIDITAEVISAYDKASQ
jgi:outer membrane protein